MKPQIEPDQEFKPLKYKSSVEDLVDALNAAGRHYNNNFFEYLAILAFQNEKVALKLLDKLLPTLKNQDLNIESSICLSAEDIIRKRREEHGHNEISESETKLKELPGDSKPFQSPIQGRLDEEMGDTEATVLHESSVDGNKENGN